LPQFKNLSPIKLFQRPFSVAPAVASQKASENIAFNTNGVWAVVNQLNVRDYAYWPPRPNE